MGDTTPLLQKEPVALTQHTTRLSASGVVARQRSMPQRRDALTHGTGGQKMWQKSKIMYSEKDVLRMLKSAPIEKLVEYLLLPRRAKK